MTTELLSWSRSRLKRSSSLKVIWGGRNVSFWKRSWNLRSWSLASVFSGLWSIRTHLQSLQLWYELPLLDRGCCRASLLLIVGSSSSMESFHWRRLCWQCGEVSQGLLLRFLKFQGSNPELPSWIYFFNRHFLVRNSIVSCRLIQSSMLFPKHLWNLHLLDLSFCVFSTQVVVFRFAQTRCTWLPGRFGHRGCLGLYSDHISPLAFLLFKFPFRSWVSLRGGWSAHFSFVLHWWPLLLWLVHIPRGWCIFESSPSTHPCFELAIWLMSWWRGPNLRPSTNKCKATLESWCLTTNNSLLNTVK